MFSLLPHLPRGIKNLYEKLPGLSNDLLPGAQAFIGTLAACRNEPLWARLLKEHKHTPWRLDLPLQSNGLSVEAWHDMVNTALLRPRSPWSKDYKNDQDYQAFVATLAANGDATAAPDMQRLPALRNLLAKEEASGKANKPGDDHLTLGDDQHAPLFHNRDYASPLRDALELDQGLWAELLLDIDLAASKDNGSALLANWPPFASRLNNCQFRLAASDPKLRKFFGNNKTALSKATMCWLYSDQEGQVNIGWLALFEALREARDGLSSQLLDRLLLGFYPLRGDMPGSRHLHILPKRLWALVVFVDALERCPWQAFSRHSHWLLGTYIALAAALVRSAYVYALVHSGCITKADLPEEQALYVEMLEHRDASLLGRSATLTEDRVLGSLQRLFQETGKTGSLCSDDPENPAFRWKVTVGDNAAALKDAAQAYLTSPLYLDAVALLQGMAETYGFDFGQGSR